MGLRHFIWRGKERAVSIGRSFQGSIVLRFVDNEIVEALGGGSIEVGSTNLTSFSAANPQQEIIAAVKATAIALPRGFQGREVSGY